MTLLVSIILALWGNIQVKKMRLQGITRTFAFYVPHSHNEKNSLPLVFILHGGGGSHRSILRQTRHRFNMLADKYGFIAIYPDAFERHWNDGRGLERYRSQRENINDVLFIQSIIDTLAKIYPVDTERIFITGVSNGGLMSMRLGCELNLVKKIAPVVALMPIMLMKQCKPHHPVDVLFLIGKKDPLVPFEGGDIHFRRLRLGAVASWDSTLSFWAKVNGCSADRKEETREGVTCIFYSGCKAQTIMYIFDNGGHTLPGGRSNLPEFIVGKTVKNFMAADSIIKFFLEFEK